MRASRRAVKRGIDDYIDPVPVSYAGAADTGVKLTMKAAARSVSSSIRTRLTRDLAACG